jgi:hypothetical protein
MLDRRAKAKDILMTWVMELDKYEVKRLDFT